MSDTIHPREDPVDLEPAELVPVEELQEEPAEPAPVVDPAAREAWERAFGRTPVPSLLLDASLRIVRANMSFCREFGCWGDLEGEYFTRFYAHSFDAKRSAELFRAVRALDTGYEWQGKVERMGHEQLITVAKMMIIGEDREGAGRAPRGAPAAVPASPAAPPAAPPAAYWAFCLDITAEHHEFLQDTFMSLLVAARQKDNDTGNHIERVNQYARVLSADIANGHGPVDRQFVETIGLVAALHDVGKIGTPDDILNKSGELESWERDVMKQHTINGAYILRTYPNPMAREIALHHHERWDGSGYPHGLAGDLIPLSARIVSIADVYDALRMQRSYKDAYSHERALEHMVKEAGTHFDPGLVERFQRIAERFRAIFSDLADAP